MTDSIPPHDTSTHETPPPSELVPRAPGDLGHDSEPNPVISQLESMIQNVASYATPVLREVAARAAELAAKAGEAAGPIAHKAAGVTEDVGARLATKGRAVASDLRERSHGGEGGSSSDPNGSDRPALS
jgi:hypothetical protein